MEKIIGKSLKIALKTVKNLKIFIFNKNERRVSRPITSAVVGIWPRCWYRWKAEKKLKKSGMVRYQEKSSENALKSPSKQSKI